MIEEILYNENLKKIILSLGLDHSQENFLVDEIPDLNKDERIALLKTVKDILILNDLEKKSLEKLKSNWVMAS